MKTLFLGSAVERSGKTMITLGLALNHPGKVGYYKPFKERLLSEGDRILDQDAHLMRRVLHLDHTEEELSPFYYDITKPIKMKSVVNGFEKVRCDCDAMLVEGTRDITTGYLNDLSGMAIAAALKAEVVLISTAQTSDIERIAMLNQLLKGYKTKLRGVVLNQVEGDVMARLLERKKIRVLGSIPTMEQLKRFTVGEVRDELNAEVIVAEDKLDLEVERVLVGAMNPESALSVMRRYPKKAIITGGDRSDIQMAALSTDTSCLVLTGGLYPAGMVVSRAFEKGVPILVTMHDTLEATERMEHLTARIDPNDAERIALVKRMVRSHVDVESIYQ